MKEKKVSLELIKIVNETSSKIVINSCKVSLSPKGEVGDSVIINDEVLCNNDIVNLAANKLIKIYYLFDDKPVEYNKLEACISNVKNNTSKNDVVSEGTKFREKKTSLSKKAKTSKNNNKDLPPSERMGGKTTYIDRGKIKHGKMVKGIDKYNSNQQDIEEETTDNFEENDIEKDIFI